jgi:hypothetical protein
MYLDSIGLSHDTYLESFAQSQQNRIIGAFAMALQQGRYSGKAHDTLCFRNNPKYHLGCIFDLPGN